MMMYGAVFRQTIVDGGSSGQMRKIRVVITLHNTVFCLLHLNFALVTVRNGTIGALL